MLFVICFWNWKLISYIIGLFLEQHGYKDLQKLDPNNLTLEATKIEFDVMEYLRYCYNDKRLNPDELTDEQYNNQLKKLKNRLDTIASYHLIFKAKSSRPTAKKKGLTKCFLVR